MDHDPDSHSQLVGDIETATLLHDCVMHEETTIRVSYFHEERVMQCAILILCRYASNTGLLILNKWLLSMYGFRRPVFLTLCHMLACSAMGAGAGALRIVPPQPVSKRSVHRSASLWLIRAKGVIRVMHLVRGT